MWWRSLTRIALAERRKVAPFMYLRGSRLISWRVKVQRHSEKHPRTGIVTFMFVFYRRRLSKAVVSGITGFLLSGLSLLVPEVLVKPVAIPGVCFIALC